MVAIAIAGLVVGTMGRRVGSSRCIRFTITMSERGAIARRVIAAVILLGLIPIVMALEKILEVFDSLGIKVTINMM